MLSSTAIRLVNGSILSGYDHVCVLSSSSGEETYICMLAPQ